MSPLDAAAPVDLDYDPTPVWFSPNRLGHFGGRKPIGGTPLIANAVGESKNMSNPAFPDEHLCIQKDTTSEQILARQTSIFQESIATHDVPFEDLKFRIAGRGATQWGRVEGGGDGGDQGDQGLREAAHHLGAGLLLLLRHLPEPHHLGGWQVHCAPERKRILNCCMRARLCAIGRVRSNCVVSSKQESVDNIK